jgi:hypothetical protein
MSTAIEGLVFGYRKNLDYGLKLVADLAEHQWSQPPATDLPAPANHPAWVFSHLNAYLPVIAAVIQGEPFSDPKDHPFGMQSHPQDDRTLYLAGGELQETFATGHEQIIQLLEGSDASVLEQPITLPRWKEIMPRAGIALPYLMLNHENIHLGQVSAWRRVKGFPSV